MSKDLWVFGYGSIVWRVDFPYLEHKPAYIRNWVRRFWQGSTDHRGVPENPGRVVTLISKPGELCWGRAYRVDSNRKAEVLSHLDHRERGGYDRLLLDIHFDDVEKTEGITYYATENNPNFLGEASDTNIAKQITNAHGPSGSNIEYVYKLQESLQEINANDPHVKAIADRVKSLEDF